LRLTRLSLKNFRNYSALNFEPCPGFNYISGLNGAGKTNLLEAIYFLIHLRSFRRIHRSRMVAEGSEGMHLRGEFTRHPGAAGPTLEATVQGRERKYRADGKEATDLLAYLGRVHAVVFFPESLQVMKGGPALRRAFFDRAIAAEDPRHLAEAREYNRILLERNRLLRGTGTANSDIITVWEQRLLKSAARIIARRHQYLESLRRHLSSLEQRLAPGLAGSMEVEYAAAAAGAGRGGERWADLLGRPTPAGSLEGKAEDLLREAAERARSEEGRRGSTLWGPHLDDFRVLLGGRRAKETASQGEQRLLTIALVAATVESYREARRDEPIVLLDDLSSELDERRREDVLRYLGSMGAQVFITSTERPGARPAEAGCFSVEGGILTACRSRGPQG